MGAHVLCFIGTVKIQGRIKEEDGLKLFFFLFKNIREAAEEFYLLYAIL